MDCADAGATLVQQVDEIYLMKDKQTGQSKGCAFVKFGSVEIANAAIEGLHQKMTMPGATQPLIAKWADAPKPKNPMGMMGGMMGMPGMAAPAPAPAPAPGAGAFDFLG